MFPTCVWKQLLTPPPPCSPTSVLDTQGAHTQQVQVLTHHPVVPCVFTYQVQVGTFITLSSLVCANSTYLLTTFVPSHSSTTLWSVVCARTASTSSLLPVASSRYKHPLISPPPHPVVPCVFTHQVHVNISTTCSPLGV